MRGSDPTPYILFPGTAREALERYREVFGGQLELHTFADFGRSDGEPERIAHGILRGDVTLYGADAGPGEQPFSAAGVMFSLLGTAEPPVLHRWFDDLAAGGEVLEPLTERPWGAWDGQVRDHVGLVWLVGYEVDQPA